MPVTETVTVSNLIASTASLVSVIWLATDRQTDPQKHTDYLGLVHVNLCNIFIILKTKKPDHLFSFSRLNSCPAPRKAEHTAGLFPQNLLDMESILEEGNIKLFLMSASKTITMIGGHQKNCFCIGTGRNTTPAQRAMRLKRLGSIQGWASCVILLINFHIVCPPICQDCKNSIEYVCSS